MMLNVILSRNSSDTSEIGLILVTIAVNALKFPGIGYKIKINKAIQNSISNRFKIDNSKESLCDKFIIVCMVIATQSSTDGCHPA